MKTKKPEFIGTLTVIEVAQLQAGDLKERSLFRGAPSVRAHGGPKLLGRLIEEIDHSDFTDLLARYRQGRPERDTGRRLIQEFNRLVSWARKNGYRNAPFNNFRCPPKKPLSDNLLSQEELAQVVKAIDSEYIGNLPIRLVLRSISSLGLGVKEALRFSLNRVDFDRWEYIQDDVSGRLRLIPIPKDMRVLVARARQIRTPDGKTSLNGEPITKIPTVQMALKKIGKRCNRPDLTPQLLRFSFLNG